LDESIKRKRKGVDKNHAFIEFKEGGEGRNIETEIVNSRN
jgi:hypothetical protein